MNLKVQEILHNQMKKNTKSLDVKMIYINKPPVVQSSNPRIFVDEDTYFYTFDGRGLIISDSQKSPYVSLPHETISLFVFRDDEGVPTVIALSSQRRLEICTLDAFGKGNKTAVSKNVQQVIKTRNMIFYLLKKGSLYFIDELAYHMGRWIGKHVCSPISGNDVKIYPTSYNGFICIVDGRAYNLQGQLDKERADVAYGTDKCFIIGRPSSGPTEPSADEALAGSEEPCGYELVCYNKKGVRKNSYFINTKHVCSVRFVGDYVGVLNENKFYLLETSEEGINLFGIYEQKFTNYDFSLVKGNDSSILIYFLADETNLFDLNQCTLLKDGVISGKNRDEEDISSNMGTNYQQIEAESNEPVATFGSVPEVEGAESQRLAENDLVTGLDGLNIANTQETAVVGDSVQFEALGRGLDVLRNEAEEISKQPPPRNHLFDAIKESIGKSAGGNVSLSPSKSGWFKGGPTTLDMLVKESMETDAHEEEIDADRFEKYANEIMFGLESGDFSRIESSPPDEIPLPVVNAKPSRGKSSAQAKHGGRASTGTPLQNSKTGESSSLNNRQKTEIYNIVYDALESIIVKNESFIKDIIARSIVPGMEAAINEMRVQIITEFRKMDFSSSLDPMCSRASTFKRLINTGKIGVALQELIKLKGPEFETLLAIFQPGIIEDVDSNVLALFIIKISNSFRKHLSEHHIKLIHDAFEDIDVSELSVENLQGLSVSIRNIKESGALESSNHASLNYLIDFICKKIRRRASNQ